jgi:hypothetical protein
MTRCEPECKRHYCAWNERVVGPAAVANLRRIPAVRRRSLSHQLLAAVAQDCGHSEVQLTVGIYEMSEENTPGVGTVLNANSNAVPTLGELSFERRRTSMEKLLPLIIVLVVLLGMIGISVLTVRWARKSSRRAAFLGWGLQFLGAGVNPVPPPQVQLEEVNDRARIKKDAESGDPE